MIILALELHIFINCVLNFRFNNYILNLSEHINLMLFPPQRWLCAASIFYIWHRYASSLKLLLYNNIIVCFKLTHVQKNPKNFTSVMPKL